MNKTKRKHTAGTVSAVCFSFTPRFPSATFFAFAAAPNDCCFFLSSNASWSRKRPPPPPPPPLPGRGEIPPE